MKPIRIICGLLAAAAAGLCFAWTAQAGDINLGDPAEKVTAVLGQPIGHMRLDKAEEYLYDRGTVDVRDADRRHEVRGVEHSHGHSETVHGRFAMNSPIAIGHARQMALNGDICRANGGRGCAEPFCITTR